MLTIKTTWLTGALGALALSQMFALVPQANARTYSDRGASIIVLPKIVVNGDNSTDTVIKLFNNDRDQPVSAHCFYVNANSHCSDDGSVCTSTGACSGGGTCQQDWQELDFDVVLTREQPLVWRASLGLRGDDLPCPDSHACPAARSGVGVRQSNAGTGIPPVGESPFLGELKCIQVDPTTANRLPLNCSTPGCSAGQNDLAGSAIIETAGAVIDTAQYNAIGIHTNDQTAVGQNIVTSTGNNGDGNLAIGGSQADAEHEYEPCPDTIVLNHLFDGASDPISGNSTTTTLTLVPCSEDLYTQTVTPITAQFLVYNEFEQRFSTSRQVRCLLDSQISLLDTTQSSRSIFNASIAGTVAGQTRIHGVNGGLLGTAVLQLTEGGSAAFNLNQQADRAQQDLIRIP